MHYWEHILFRNTWALIFIINIVGALWALAIMLAQVAKCIRTQWINYLFTGSQKNHTNEKQLHGSRCSLVFLSLCLYCEASLKPLLSTHGRCNVYPCRLLTHKLGVFAAWKDLLTIHEPYMELLQPSGKLLQRHKSIQENRAFNINVHTFSASVKELPYFSRTDAT